MTNEIEDKALKKAELALDHVLISMPYLVGLVQQIYLHIEPRVPTVGVFESGRMVINPLWFNDLSLSEATFIMAHELMHLMLKTHQRQGSTDAQMVNIAHDIIINFLLERKLGMPTPADGLTYEKVLDNHQHDEFEYIDNISLEKVIGLLSKSSRFNNSVKSWSKDYIFTSGDRVTNSTDLGRALKEALNPQNDQQKKIGKSPKPAMGNASDVMTIEEELALYPKETLKAIQQHKATIQQEAINAIAQEQIFEEVQKALNPSQNRGYNTGNSIFTLNALRHHYAPPWQWAMQQWLEATSSAQNTYARPSRRGQHADFVRPGKHYEGFTIHIVLDTSGSMAEELSKILGVIGAFCEATSIETIHILQCDTTVTVDEWVYATDLENYAIHGYGGSDMSPAMLQLAEDSEVERIIVITDGYIGFPQNPPPYQVLWVLTTQNHFFSPDYGQIIFVDSSQ